MTAPRPVRRGTFDGVLKAFAMTALVFGVLVFSEGCAISIQGLGSATQNGTGISLSPSEPTTSSVAAQTQTTSAVQQIQVLIAGADTSQIYGQAYDPNNSTTQLVVGLFVATGNVTDSPVATGMANLDDSTLASVSSTGHSFRFDLSGVNVPAGTQVLVKAESPSDPSQIASSSPVVLQAASATQTAATTSTSDSSLTTSSSQ
jgi:hypothetical protein